MPQQSDNWVEIDTMSTPYADCALADDATTKGS